MKDVIVGTAGHIDHGKTALVRALTGIDTDRLAEEKRRGITIDIGFAHMDLDDTRVGFIDVPGHERFVKNMLAGIGGIHLLLLVVAADESIMPQTVEHFEICNLLGIPRGVVVLTKRSLVDEEIAALVREEVSDFVKGTFLSSAPVIAVDSLSGDGIPQLKHAIAKEIRALRREEIEFRTNRRVFVLPVDRVFTIKGFGTVVTGTASAGSVKRDETVTIHPVGLEAKIRGVEIFGKTAESTASGQRIALNLSGVAVDQLARGMVISPSRTLQPTTVLDTRIELLPSAPGPLRHRSPVRFHQGSAELMARVYLFGRSSLAPGTAAFAQVRLEQPGVCLPRDRFILRKYSPLLTVGGGIVLDNRPSRHRKKELPALEEAFTRLLASFEAGPEEASRALVERLVRASGIRGIDLRDLVASTGLTEQSIRHQLGALPTVALVNQDPPIALDRDHLSRLEAELREELEAFHLVKPLADGMPKEELRERYAPRTSAGLFQFILEELQRRQVIELRGSSVALFGSRVEMSQEQLELQELILDSFRRNCFQSPDLERLAVRLGKEPGSVRELYFYLLQEGRLVRISDDLVMLPEQIAETTDRLRQTFPGGKTFTVPEFKDLFGISRKFAIPLLEYLDRVRLTRRTGDTRILR